MLNPDKMKLGLNCRAQASSPFELLVAVIIMTFVILIGSAAMAKLKQDKCMYETHGYMEKFKSALERVHLPGTAQTLSFKPPTCFRDEEIKLNVLAHNVCSSYCNFPGKKECVVLHYYSPEGGSIAPMCVNIPTATVFESHENCEPGAPLGKEIEPISEVRISTEIGTGGKIIEAGFYQFRNITAGAAFPRLCVYRITGVER